MGTFLYQVMHHEIVLSFGDHSKYEFKRRFVQHRLSFRKNLAVYQLISVYRCFALSASYSFSSSNTVTGNLKISTFSADRVSQLKKNIPNPENSVYHIFMKYWRGQRKGDELFGGRVGRYETVFGRNVYGETHKQTQGVVSLVYFLPGIYIQTQKYSWKSRNACTVV